MWSPKQKADGGRNQFYENMQHVSPGDVVFSFCDTRIRAIGVVFAYSQTGPKPDFGPVGANWSNEGWFVPVDFITLQNQIRPKDHIEVLRPFLPAKYSPLRATGDGLQSVYLAEVPEEMAQALIGLIGQDRSSRLKKQSLTKASWAQPSEPRSSGLVVVRECSEQTSCCARVIAVSPASTTVDI